MYVVWIAESEDSNNNNNKTFFEEKFFFLQKMKKCLTGSFGCERLCIFT